MGEEVFQLHVATPTKCYTSYVKLNRVFLPCWCATGSSFPAGVEQGILSLLVCNRVFFPCWCATGYSFPAGVQQGLLFLLVCKRIFFPCCCFTGHFFPAGDSHSLLSLRVLHKFPTLKVYHGNQTKQELSADSIAHLELGRYWSVRVFLITSLIWICIVCLSLSVPILKIIMVRGNVMAF